jgi:ABC-type multidrug transport system fused ATPase/permease subunit
MGVLFSVAKPLPIKVVIDNVLLGDDLKGFYARFVGLFNISDKEELLYLSISILVSIHLLTFLLNYLVAGITARLGMRMLFDLSSDFYLKLQKLSLSFYGNKKMGDILQRFNGDTFVVYQLGSQIILPILTSLLTFSAMFYIMALMDFSLALIAISIIPLLALALLGMSGRLNNTSKAQYEKQGELSAFVHQSLSSTKIIQAFVRESFMYRMLREKAISYENAYVKSINTSVFYNQTITLITGLASAVLLGFGAYKSFDGEVSAGELYVFLGYLTALYGPVNSLSTAFASVVSLEARGKRVIEIIDSEEYIKEVEHPIVLKTLKKGIQFENVEFRYDGQQRNVLKGINLDVKAGSTIAIIGKTGAGKTSLISLLSRFYDTSAGSIKLDGHDLKELKLKSLRENVSLVLQEPFLFPMTIAENVAFGNPYATREEIIEACKLAEAHDFISQQSSGYDTMVSESGTSLSGGEKQRVCLARAFLKESQIVILDEPTSALDAMTESRIFKRLNEHTKEKTVIMISHRLSTIKNADIIYVLDEGEFKESGSHRELISKNGLYKELYDHQNISE